MPKLTTSQMAKMTIAGITGVMPTGEQSGICVINSQQILMKVGQSLDLLAWESPQGIYEITEDFPDVGVSWFYDEGGNGSSWLLTELTNLNPVGLVAHLLLIFAVTIHYSYLKNDYNSSISSIHPIYYEQIYVC